MYTFVLLWTRVLTPPATAVVPSRHLLATDETDGHRGKIPHGYIFAAFMVSNRMAHFQVCLIAVTRDAHFFPNVNSFFIQHSYHVITLAVCSFYFVFFTARCISKIIKLSYDRHKKCDKFLCCHHWFRYCVIIKDNLTVWHIMKRCRDPFLSHPGIINLNSLVYFVIHTYQLIEFISLELRILFKFNQFN